MSTSNESQWIPDDSIIVSTRFQHDCDGKWSVFMKSREDHIFVRWDGVTCDNTVMFAVKTRDLNDSYRAPLIGQRLKEILRGL